MGSEALRTYVRQARGKRTARMLVTSACGCGAKLAIYFGGAEGKPEPIEHDGLEVGGVHGSIEEWRRILLPLLGVRAISRPPAAPVVPASGLAGYSGTPLSKKLGIKPGSTVALLGAPEGFEETLGPLPDGVSLRRGARGRRDLTLWFVRSEKELQGIERIAARGGDALWICWPKKGSTLEADVDEARVRKAGLGAGLVDYKVCAVDATWSGLKFARRKG